MNGGIDCRIHPLFERDFTTLLHEIHRDPPDATMSFNEICVSKPDTLLCDELGLPHFYWMGKRLSSAFFYLKSSYGILGCPDALLSSLLKNIGWERLLTPTPFIPAASCPMKGEKKYGSVFFATITDLENFLPERQRLYSERSYTLLKEAISLFNEKPCYPIEALISVIKREGIDFSEIQFPELLYQVEEYALAKEAFQCALNFKEGHLHIFGWHRGKDLLKKLPSTVHLHFDASYTEKFKILRMSRHALFTSILTPGGVDPLFLKSFQEGCIPLSIETPYLREHFPDFVVPTPKDLEKRVSEIEKNPLLRASLLEKGQSIVQSNYCIDNSIGKLVAQLKYFL